MSNATVTLRSLILAFERNNEPVSAMDILDWQGEGMSEEAMIHELLVRSWNMSIEKPTLYYLVNAEVDSYWKSKKEKVA